MSTTKSTDANVQHTLYKLMFFACLILCLQPADAGQGGNLVEV
jgi:hypothetical protein